MSTSTQEARPDAAEREEEENGVWTGGDGGAERAAGGVWVSSLVSTALVYLGILVGLGFPAAPACTTKWDKLVLSL